MGRFGRLREKQLSCKFRLTVGNPNLLIGNTFGQVVLRDSSHRGHSNLGEQFVTNGVESQRT
jgi:hypothetical protein